MKTLNVQPGHEGIVTILGMAAENARRELAQQKPVELVALSEKPTKRKNLGRWQTNRLRRLSFRIDCLRQYRGPEVESWPEFQRKLKRANQLAAGI